MFCLCVFLVLGCISQVDREKEMAYIIRLGHKVRACVCLCLSVLSVSVSGFLSVLSVSVSGFVHLV